MKETSKIYVDLPSLLDLRMAMLRKLTTAEQLVEYLNSDEYNFRQIDEFKMVNQSQYKHLAENMTVDLIPASMVTYILVNLKMKLANLEKRNNFYNEKKVPEVLLNIYPFVLTDEQTKSLQNMLFVKLETNTMVTIIRMAPKDVTPYFIKTSGIITTFMYSFKDWMNCHTANLEKTKLPDVFMYFPSLAFDTVDEKDLQKIAKMGFKDIFGYTEYLFSSVTNINFLPVVFYTNLITASLYVEKFNDVLKDEPVSNEPEQEKYDGNLGSTV